MGYHLYGVVPAETWPEEAADAPTSGGPEEEGSAPAETLLGLGEPPAPVQAVIEEDLAALVSPLPEAFTVARPHHLTRHYDVLVRLVERGPVLPFRFGVYLDAVPDVRALVQANARSLRAELNRLGDGVEAGVTAFWSRERAASWLRSQPESGRAVKALRGAPAAQRQNLLAHLGEQVEDLVESWRRQVQGPVASALRSVAREVELLEPGGVRVLLNIACLVDRERIPALVEAVERIDQKSSLDLRFRVRAPLPPFTFARLVLHTAKGGAPTRA